jgi:hypothetical protein
MEWTATRSARIGASRGDAVSKRPPRLYAIFGAHKRESSRPDEALPLARIAATFESVQPQAFNSIRTNCRRCSVRKARKLRQRQSCAKTPVPCSVGCASTVSIWRCSVSVSRSLEPQRRILGLGRPACFGARLGSNPCAGSHVGVDGAAPLLRAPPTAPR